MRHTALLIIFSLAIVRAKANFGSLAALPNFNKGFQRFMDSSALEVYAQTNNDAHTGDEYMLKKQRTDASEVTNPWLVRIFCSKDMFERV